MTIYVLFVGYLAGLLLTGLGPVLGTVGKCNVTVGMVGVALGGAIASFLIPRFWRMGPRSPLWLIAGLVGVAAGLYLQVRSPSYTQLTRAIPITAQPTFPMEVGVQGEIIDAPQLTRSQSVRFTLHVTDIQSWEKEVQEDMTAPGADANNGSSPQRDIAPALATLTRKLYVTVPLLQGTGLKPGDAIALHGRLYRPKATVVPGAFDFQQYLERQGIFAALQAEAVHPSDYRPSPSRSALMSWRRGTWMMRQRIVRSFVRGLDSPTGQLLSAMVLGRKAVDLPFDVRDDFIQAGLAHTMAASGFHVSLLLGMVLWLTRRLSPQQQGWIGGGVLLGYASLTGFQPSVCRAVLMGLAVLLATAAERKIRPLAALLGIATLLLMMQPSWIGDLGFQLSFLATVGLVVMVPGLVKRLDWLPVGIATAIAVPITAMIWTLPILLRMMGTILPYSVFLSLLTTPFIGLFSLSGMGLGAIALISPALGSLGASLLYWPLQGLMAVVRWCNGLPGQSIALGSIALWQLVLIYGLYALVIWTGQPSLLKHKLYRVSLRSLRRCVGPAILLALLIPLFYHRYQTVQITIFPTRSASPPLMVIQYRGQVGLVNNGTLDDVQYTLLPFFRHEGINGIDWAIATRPALNSSDQIGSKDLDSGPTKDTQNPAPSPAATLVSSKSASAFSTANKLQPSTLTWDLGWDRLAQTVAIRQIYQIAASASVPVAPISHGASNGSSRSPDRPDSVAAPNIQALSVGRSLDLGTHATLTPLSTSPTILELVLGPHHWLIWDQSLPLSLAELSSLSLPSSHVWYWAGDPMDTVIPFLNQLPQQVIPQQAMILPILPDMEQLRSTNLAHTSFYSPNLEHVVQWMPEDGFSILTDGPETDEPIF